MASSCRTVYESMGAMHTLIRKHKPGYSAKRTMSPLGTCSIPLSKSEKRYYLVAIPAIGLEQRIHKSVLAVACVTRSDLWKKLEGSHLPWHARIP
jgi:hypothetical protein